MTPCLRGVRHLIVGVLPFVICCSAAPASATVVLPADFTTVVTEAGIIVHGRVVDVRSDATGPRRVIESFVTVVVLESLKGAPGTSVTFRVPNGQVGRYRRILVGAPEFAEGDEVVVFLTGRPPAMPTVFGLSQGVYRVTRNAAGRAVVTPPPVTAGTGRIIRGDPARGPMPVDAFAREVRTILERSR
ncbi:MAG: hypothetical protein HYX77_00905 [Acidobacteria bacterium]|nr:hypothetical protein [Acidobacteriota bacterium]